MGHERRDLVAAKQIGRRAAEHETSKARMSVSSHAKQRGAVPSSLVLEGGRNRPRSEWDDVMVRSDPPALDRFDQPLGVQVGREGLLTSDGQQMSAGWPEQRERVAKRACSRGGVVPGDSYDFSTIWRGMGRRYHDDRTTTLEEQMLGNLPVAQNA